MVRGKAARTAAFRLSAQQTARGKLAGRTGRHPLGHGVQFARPGRKAAVPRYVRVMYDLLRK